MAICTPTNTHYQMILDAAAAGKHIFCEKPIDLALEKIAEINAEVARRGVQMMVGFNRRFDPNFLKVHETVKAGRNRRAANPAHHQPRSGAASRDLHTRVGRDLPGYDHPRFRHGALPGGSEVVEVYAAPRCWWIRCSSRPAIGTLPW